MKALFKLACAMLLVIAATQFARSQDGYEGDHVDSRLIVPGEAELAEATKSIKLIFSAEYVRAEKSDGSKSLLSKRVLTTARETVDDPVSRFAGVTEAKRLAIEASDVATMLQSIDLLSSEYQISMSEIVADSLESFDIADSSLSCVKDLVEIILPSIERAALIDDLNAAIRILKVGEVVATRISDRRLQLRLDAVRKQLDLLQDQFLTYQKAVARLEKDPADSEANCVAGLYLGLRLDSWEGGEKLIALGGDKQLHNLFLKQCALPTNEKDALALADAWWDWSILQDDPLKSQSRLVALAWYEASLSNLSGLAKKRADERLKTKVTTFPLRCISPPSEVEEIVLEFSEEVVLFLPFDDGDADGKFGKAVLLDSSSRIDVEVKNLPAGNAPRSIMFWIRTDQRSGDVVPFRYGNLAPLDAVYIFLPEMMRGERGRPGYILKGQAAVGSVGGGPPEFAGGQILTNGKWHHIALTHDGVSSSTLFVDGKRVAQTRREFDTTPSDTLLIGRYDNGPTMQGELDDFVILNRVVKVAEIARIMSNGVLQTLGKPAK